MTVKLEDTEWRHLDYYPVVNARAHTVGDLENWTLNRNFK
jgi:sporulation protein YlmC with PRC-barrel domain